VYSNTEEDNGNIKEEVATSATSFGFIAFWKDNPETMKFIEDLIFKNPTSQFSLSDYV
jgi:hypothetical protein